MPPADEAQRLARVAAVADDLDKILDRLFATAAELKVILGRNQPGAPEMKQQEAP